MALPYLINLSPTILDTRNIVQGRAVFPERSALYIKDEPNCGEVEVGITIFSDRVFLCDVDWRGRTLKRALGRNLGADRDGGRILG